MRDLVIVVSDLYLSQESPDRELPMNLPGLLHATRFATQLAVPQGWRPWVARWLGASALERAAPATVAAFGQVPGTVDPPTVDPGTLDPGTVWIATPVHLLAGMTSLHLDRRGILRLSPEDQSQLASGFQRDFHDSGFQLRPLDSGEFLLFGPTTALSARPEPVRMLGQSLADSRRSSGAQDRALSRLSSEMEMWLHGHAVNEARRRRGEVPVSGLWFWGGGPLPVTGVTTESPTQTATTLAFGRDSYLLGLCASIGATVVPLPQHATELFSYSHARRAVLVLELGTMLHSNPAWTFFDALARVDRDFVSPAVEALTVGRLERLVMLANDRQLALRSRDRFKLWRRARPGLSGLQ